jgi:hypothetical protein
MQKLISSAIAVAVLASSLAAQGAIGAPCFVNALGANLALTDDSVAVGLPLGFSFPAPGGSAVTAISVSSNGFVWLGSNADSGCCNGDANKLTTQMARIAPFWLDLNPSAGGAVWFNTFPAVGTTPASAVITWDQVPEFQGFGNPMTFQLQMFGDGSFVLLYDPNVAATNHTALVGLSQGISANQNNFDLSSSIGTPVDTGNDPTAFEQFFFGFDLSSTVLTFIQNGQGGYTFTNKSGCNFATVTAFGDGCPKPTTFYELFDFATPIDLSNTAIEFTPNGQGGYAAVPTTGFFAGTTNFLLFSDDQVQGPFNLPFTFPYPGGTTTDIDISSNGFIWMQTGNSDSRCCNGNVFSFLSDPASLCVLWEDLLPPAASPGNGVFFDVVGTWLNVPEFGSGGSNTAQITLRANGSFRLSWGAVANLSHDALVGFSQGNGSPDPGSIDLSAGPFSTGSGGTPLQLSAAVGSRPSLGSNFPVNVGNITTGSALGFMVLGLTQLPGGVDLTVLGSPGCTLYVSLDVVLPVPLLGNPTPFAVLLPSSPALAGVLIEAQAATLTPGATPLGILTSNGLELTLGL